MRTLVMYEEYSRQEAHNIFSPDSTFTPNSGSWGLHGIVAIREQPGNYVFFVTGGQHQADHFFDEWITQDGIISWQSQPRQDLENKTIQQFLHHDESIHSIHLFLRTHKAAKYTYLGRLKYLSHDPERNNPVNIIWQIMDWNIPQEVVERMNLNLRRNEDRTERSLQDVFGLYNNQNESTTQTSFLWKKRDWEVDPDVLLNSIKSWIKKGLPDEATRFRDWYIEVDGNSLSPKWVFHLITNADYNEFDAPTARAKLRQIEISSFQVSSSKVNHKNRRSNPSSKQKIEPERRIKKEDFSDTKHLILEQKVTEIQRYLNGESNPPTDEILCDWISFCYSFQLFNEGIRLFRLINSKNVNEWYYAKIQKLAKICDLKSKSME